MTPGEGKFLCLYGAIVVMHIVNIQLIFSASDHMAPDSDDHGRLLVGGMLMFIDNIPLKNIAFIWKHALLM